MEVLISIIIFGVLCGLISHLFFDDNRSKSYPEIKVLNDANSAIKSLEKVSETIKSSNETKKQNFIVNDIDLKLLKNYVCNLKNICISDGIVINSIQFIPKTDHFKPYIVGLVNISQELESLLCCKILNKNFVELRLYGEDIEIITKRALSAEHKIENNIYRKFSEKNDGLIFEITKENDEGKAKIRRDDQGYIKYIYINIKNNIKFFSIEWNKLYDQKIIENQKTLNNQKENSRNKIQNKSNSIVYANNFQGNTNQIIGSEEDSKNIKQLTFHEDNNAGENKNLKIVGQAKPTTFPEIQQQKSTIDSKFAEFNIRSFWHISHINNIKSILDNGILSYNTAKNSNLAYLDISNQSVQRWREYSDPHYHRKIHEYAPLYINPKNPMLYVKRELQNELCLIEVSLSVLLNNDYLISDGNASAKNTCFYNSIEKLHLLSWDVIHSKMWTDFEDGKRKKCAEILIFPKIEPEFIFKIHCKTQKSRLKILNYFKNTYFSPNLFF